MIGWILRPQNGALNQILEAVGLGELAAQLAGQTPTRRCLSIMVVMVWVQLGYPVVIFMAALQRVDPELYEAAELDGANWFQRFRAITVEHHPPRDLRRDAHLHDRGAQGLRPGLRADPRRPRHVDDRARATTRTASSSSRSRSATARPSRPRSRSSIAAVSVVFIRVQNRVEKKEEGR